MVSRIGPSIALCLAVLCLPMLSTAGSTQLKVRTASALALPQDRLHFGLASDPGNIGWMTSSGVPWRYRYQYLAGGVNTGTGWETWNTPTGAFAATYMASSAANNYIPVFTYYELLQSQPSTGSNESDRDYLNLNNSTTMNAYFANFKLLMQQAGTFGKPVVVHVEPDFWGYMEQKAAGASAAAVSAKVAGSGFADVAGIPDTVQGFGEALLKLRDLYAPNAVMAIHASAWGSNIDIASSTDPSINAMAVADVTAGFLNSAGITSNPYGSTWDLVFNDVDDHDAAWWEAQGADNQYSTHWWDTSNTTFPNFTRYLAWVSELKAKTARPQVVWQVPVGNQYFLTMNNTCGHYQDNVGPYFINHASQLFAAGLIAVLFGAGNACQTSYDDAANDGVTNNGGATTTDALGYCSACNNHTSVWADDDGGFLRIFVGLYYSGAEMLGGVITSDPDAASWAAGHLDVFARGQDNAIWHRAWNGTTWGSWDSLGGVSLSDAGAVSGTANRIDVFIRGRDNALWHRVWNGSSWASWESLGGVLSAGPDASSWGAARLDVFIRGQDNALWHRWWDGTAWHGWEGLGGVLASDPTVVSWGANQIDVFIRGQDRALWHRSWNGTAWQPWEGLGGVLNSSPDVSSCAAGKLDVFVVGQDGALWRRSFSAGAWGGWTSLGGQWTSGPGAVCQPGTTKIDLFQRGTDSALWRVEIAS
ncbi:MAG: hypothetical protein E6J40_01845 [Chloroflexi bacterium]|nr:MAG: hypothetical protein E6J40_01845 [Chloroflexota bacterium]